MLSLTCSINTLMAQLLTLCHHKQVPTPPPALCLGRALANQQPLQQMPQAAQVARRPNESEVK